MAKIRTTKGSKGNKLADRQWTSKNAESLDKKGEKRLKMKRKTTKVRTEQQTNQCYWVGKRLTSMPTTTLIINKLWAAFTNSYDQYKRACISFTQVACRACRQTPIKNIPSHRCNMVRCSRWSLIRTQLFTSHVSL